MARISKKERMEQIKEQVMDITMRIEYLAENEPEILSYIQRTIEGLYIIDKEVIKIENTKKRLAMRLIARIREKKYINGAFDFVSAFEKLDNENK